MTMNPEDITQGIKSLILQEGFSHCGIARADQISLEESRLRTWLELNYHGTMHWMAKNVEKRTDPRVILTDAKSMIVAAMNYYVSQPHSSKKDVGKISRYAWGDDYHEIVSDKFRNVSESLTAQFPNDIFRPYVDTGPVMEKAWAQRAGIGWIGKHTNLITPDSGSWVFLGVIITTLPLMPDTMETDHCGTCTLCIEACPTDAIAQPYVLDSNKCISYLTIEHRGEISRELAERFDGWVYGCDICQDVCPWNHKFATQTSERGFQPRVWNIAPDLVEWENMTEEEFQRKFRKSPIKRTKLSGVKRNGKVASDARNNRKDM